MTAVLREVNKKPATKRETWIWLKWCLGFDAHQTCRCRPRNALEAAEWAKDDRQPHQSQLDYIYDGFLNLYSACVLMACRGAGKSFATAALCVLDCWFKPRLQVAVAAFVRQQSDYIYTYICKFLDHFGKILGQKAWTITKDEITFHNGSVVKFFSGGKSSANVTGYHPHVLIVDEADKFSAEQFDGIANGLEGGKEYPSRFDVLSTNYSLSGDGVILKQIERYEHFNETKPDHLLPRKIFRICLIDILAQCDDRFKCYDEIKKVHCPLWKYCKGRAKEQDGFYEVGEAIGKQLNSSLQTFESQMLLLRPSSEYAIFGGFSIATHVLDPDLPYDPKKESLLVFDFGGKRCPHAALLIQRVPPKEKGEVTTYEVIDEFEGMGLLENLIASIKAKYPKACEDAAIFADPSGTKKQQTEGGISYIGALKKAGFFPYNRPVKRKPSFELVKALIEPASGERKLVVNKRCKNLIKQLQAAEYEVRAGKPTGEPADSGHDDLLDCLRYTVAATCGTYAKHSGSKRIMFF